MLTSADPALEKTIGRRVKNFFLVETVAGRTVITVHRSSAPPEVILCLSPGHANQVRMRLSDQGLPGLVEGAR